MRSATGGEGGLYPDRSGCHRRGLLLLRACLLPQAPLSPRRSTCSPRSRRRPARARAPACASTSPSSPCVPTCARPPHTASAWRCTPSHSPRASWAAPRRPRRRCSSSCLRAPSLCDGRQKRRPAATMTRAHAPAASPLPLGVARRGGHGRLALRALRRLERSRSAASHTGRPRRRRWRSTAESSCAGWRRRRSPRSRRRTPRGTWGRWVNALSALLEGAGPVCPPDGSKGSARSLRHSSACRGLWSSPQLAREMRLLPLHTTRWATLSSSTPRARASSAAPRRRRSSTRPASPRRNSRRRED